MNCAEAVSARLPAAAQQLYKVAFSDALTHVFLLAAPAVLVAFALTWLLHEAPLRTAQSVAHAESPTAPGPGARRLATGP